MQGAWHASIQFGADGLSGMQGNAPATRTHLGTYLHPLARTPQWPARQPPGDQAALDSLQLSARLQGGLIAKRLAQQAAATP